jgi:cytochrome P450
MTTTITGGEPHSFDLSDPDAFANGPPHAVFARLRSEDPVSWNVSSGGDDFWSVTRHADISLVTRDHRTYSSAKGSITIRPGTLVPREMEQMVFIMMDPPQNRKHRNIVKDVFTSTMVREREPMIRELAVRQIESVLERGECDFVADLAVDLPLRVIASILGVPEADRDKLFAWTNILVATDDPELRASDEVLFGALGEMAQYLLALAADRRSSPKDDVLSRLLLAELDGERLDDVELLSVFSLLLGGGNETTRNTIAGGMRALIENPDGYRRLVSDPSLIPVAAEEMLRWVTPFNYMARTTTCDTVLNGTEIKADQKVVMWLASGNRDETAFLEPSRFDIARDPCPHLSFGAGGPHHCLGLQLARLELKVFFEELLKRIPDAELSGTPQRIRSAWLNGYKAMPIAFTPTSP